jgi:hypothetical protein
MILIICRKGSFSPIIRIIGEKREIYSTSYLKELFNIDFGNYEIFA